jgi:hypothetical protein
MGATRRRARRPLDGLARVPTWQLHHRADGRPETRAGNAETPREHVARGPENSYGSSPMSAPAQPRSVGGLRAIGRHGQLGALLVATLLLGNAASFVVPFMSLWGTGHVGMTSLGFGLFMTSTSLSSTVAQPGHRTLVRDGCDAPQGAAPGGSAGILGYAGYATIDQPWLLALLGAAGVGLASSSFPQLFAHAREGAPPRRVNPRRSPRRRVQPKRWLSGNSRTR